MNYSPSILPLTTPVLAEQASRYVILQAALRAAGKISASHANIRDQSRAISQWFEPQIASAITPLRKLDWWQEPKSDQLVAEIIKLLDGRSAELAQAPVEEVLQVATLDGLISLQQYFNALVSEPNAVEGDIDDHLRMIADGLAVAEVPVRNLIWPKGAYRLEEADGRVVSVLDDDLPVALRVAAGDATHVLLAPHLEATPLAAVGRVACELVSADADHVYRMGQLCALVDTLQLLGLHQRQGDERTTIAHVFAAVVQQQQHLMMSLEQQGFRLDMGATNLPPAECEPLQAFALGSHDVFLSELRAINQAKIDNRLVAHTLEMYDRVKGQAERLLQADPMIPTPEDGWIPSRKDIRDKARLRAHVLAFARTSNGATTPVIFQLPANVSGGEQRSA